MAALTDFVRVHGAEHSAQREESQAAHDRFDGFIRSFELAAARKAGALGVFRFAIELLSKHARPLVAVLGAAAVLIASLAGAFRVEVIIR